MEKLYFQNQQSLIPAIIQEKSTGEVLMLGYMNKEAFDRTKTEGLVYFWSRKREKLWLKGETSGNKLKVVEIYKDCDNDTILIKVVVKGKNVCHLGRKSCFTVMKYK